MLTQKKRRLRNYATGAATERGICVRPFTPPQLPFTHHTCLTLDIFFSRLCMVVSVFNVSIAFHFVDGVSPVALADSLFAPSVLVIILVWHTVISSSAAAELH
jgi:hypothetical protein